MKLKKFNEYSNIYSKDPRNFEKKIGLACSNNTKSDIFKIVESTDSSQDLPIILWNSNLKINENSSFLFNRKRLPLFEEICDTFANESFIPSTVTDRTAVKKLKFPITGISKDGKEDFKTYGKFKKSENQFSKFREKITPTTRFDIIAFKKEPIHIQERINTIGFDSKISEFRYLDQVDNIINKIHTEYPTDFYHVGLIESNGKLYLDSIDTSLNLSPSQSIKMYETAYENYYETALPNWFKKTIFENQIKPYYKSRYYDALLIKPKNSIDFKKYLD